MEKPSNKKESGINRIVGFDDKKESSLLNYFKRRLEDNAPYDKDKEKSPELEKMIVRINEKMVDFLEGYGVHAISIPSESIHLLDKTKFSPEELQKFEEKHQGNFAFYSAMNQRIILMKDYQDGEKLPFMNTLVHEMLHLQGFYSYQATSPESADITLKGGGDKVNLNIRRTGFSVGASDGKELLFNDVNEAMITELSIRFGREYYNEWPELDQEINARDEYIKKFAQQEDIPIEKVREMIGSTTLLKWASYSYNNERKKLNAYIDDLYNKNKADFSSREAVFDLFAKTTLTGKILPLARIIEKTYGKGSFRELGEKTTRTFN